MWAGRSVASIFMAVSFISIRKSISFFIFFCVIDALYSGFCRRLFTRGRNKGRAKCFLLSTSLDAWHSLQQFSMGGFWLYHRSHNGQKSIFHVKYSSGTQNVFCCIENGWLENRSSKKGNRSIPKAFFSSTVENHTLSFPVHTKGTFERKNCRHFFIITDTIHGLRYRRLLSIHWCHCTTIGSHNNGSTNYIRHHRPCLAWR